ncbi:CrcB family protein [Pseudonocardia kujensis]|uniref:fluoride efflux transporter FluC n=1 Tax=Pseudonocardia kujensis TaxID=1128675 RepID=UPI001E297A86|nr:CrcB family protein [Pseudonocardia kujensis]MCE0764388.1 CrcB family protein [Pseudonocardia kujensis]
MTVLLVALGAMVGAPLRFLTDRTIKRWVPGLFPWGTFAVNVVGSLTLGVVAAVADLPTTALAGTGFCGALTTYSTFSYETFALLEGRHRLIGVTNVVGSVAVGIAAATAGWALGHAL